MAPTGSSSAPSPPEAVKYPPSEFSVKYAKVIIIIISIIIIIVTLT